MAENSITGLRLLDGGDSTSVELSGFDFLEKHFQFFELSYFMRFLFISMSYLWGGVGIVQVLLTWY